MPNNTAENMNDKLVDLQEQGDMQDTDAIGESSQDVAPVSGEKRPEGDPVDSIDVKNSV